MTDAWTVLGWNITIRHKGVRTHSHLVLRCEQGELYKTACGRYAKTHCIRPDQSELYMRCDHCARSTHGRVWRVTARLLGT